MDAQYTPKTMLAAKNSLPPAAVRTSQGAEDVSVPTTSTDPMAVVESALVENSFKLEFERSI